MNKCKSIRARVKDLKTGQTLSVSVDEFGYNTLRNYACDLGFALNRTYTTTRNRETRTISITRLS